jgi:hypothetical protein
MADICDHNGAAERSEGRSVAGCERNLVLVQTPNLQARSDFETVKAKLADRAPDIEVFIVHNDARQSVTRRQAAGRPTLIFSPVALKQFAPLRGKVYAGRQHTKMEEIRKMVAAGIQVPEAVMIGPETRLDPATWGPYTVVKPNIGKQGRGVRLMRTGDVRWVDPVSLPKGNSHHGVPLLAQKFVDTGAHATSYRVLTVFGRPVYSAVSRSTNARRLGIDQLATEQSEEPIASNLDGPSRQTAARAASNWTSRRTSSPARAGLHVPSPTCPYLESTSSANGRPVDCGCSRSTPVDSPGTSLRTTGWTCNASTASTSIPNSARSISSPMRLSTSRAAKPNRAQLRRCWPPSSAMT